MKTYGEVEVYVPMSHNYHVGTFLQLRIKQFVGSHRVGEKIGIQNSGGISDYVSIIYNFKV